MNRLKTSPTAKLCLISLLCCGGSHAQVNSWTKPTSGNWEEPYWSLGVLPSSNHFVEFGNPGWKALTIGPSTRSFPESLTISDLSVTTPADSFNVLFLNYAGMDAPLRVLQTFMLGTNSRAHFEFPFGGARYIPDRRDGGFWRILATGCPKC